METGKSEQSLVYGIYTKEFLEQFLLKAEEYEREHKEPPTSFHIRQEMVR